MHDTRTPLLMSVMNILLNLIVEIPLLWWLGEAGMAVGTLVSFAIQAVLTLWLLDRRVGGLDLGRIAMPVLKMCVAAAVMWAACVLVRHLPGYPHAATRFSWLVQLLTLIAIGAAVYLGAVRFIGSGNDPPDPAKTPPGSDRLADSRSPIKKSALTKIRPIPHRYNSAMKSFIILVLLAALSAAAFFTRPSEASFRDMMAQKSTSDDTHVLSRFFDQVRGKTLADGCVFNDRLLYVSVQKDGKTAYTGAVQPLV